METKVYQPFGIETLDVRHRALINMSCGLALAIREQICKYVIKNVVRSLEYYSTVHFGEEEWYMELYRYPDLALHKGEHRRFATEVVRLKDGLLNMDPFEKEASYELSVEINQFVADWLSEHMAGKDTELGYYLACRMAQNRLR